MRVPTCRYLGKVHKLSKVTRLGCGMHYDFTAVTIKKGRILDIDR